MCVITNCKVDYRHFSTLYLKCRQILSMNRTERKMNPSLSLPYNEKLQTRVYFATDPIDTLHMWSLQTMFKKREEKMYLMHLSQCLALYLREKWFFLSLLWHQLMVWSLKMNFSKVLLFINKIENKYDFQHSKITTLSSLTWLH